jgi:TonB-dependent receptor
MDNSHRTAARVLGAAVFALGAFGLRAQSVPAPLPAASAASPAVSTELDEVTVIGYRASLEKSLDIKRDAPIVMDSINATELGRFPDADVADSLAHLPGITISRTTGGEGVKINVRGLGPEYNIVSLDGRILATDDDARDLAFDVLPSEVISGADVLKSSQASALEGSVGGTVNLRTARPLDNPGVHAGVHVEGNHNQMTDLSGSKYSGFVSMTNDDHTMGFLLSGVYSDNKIRTDSLNAYNQADWAVSTYPYDADPNNPPPGTITLTATPCCITFGSIYDEKKRSAASGNFQWRPRSDITLTADVIYTHLNDPQIGYNESYYFPFFTASDGLPAWGVPTIDNGLVTAVDVREFQPEMVNNTINRQVNTWLYGLNGAWDVNDRLNLALDVYRSTASRPEGGTDTFVTAGLVSDTPFGVDTLIMQDLPHSLPSLNVLVPPSQLGLTACPAGTASSTNPGSCSYTNLMNSGYLNNNKYWSTHYVGLNGYSVSDQVNSVALDGKFSVQYGPVKRMLFGISTSQREKARTDISNDWTNGSGQYGTLYNTAGGTIQPSPYTFAAQGFNVISMTSPPNFMHGAGGYYPTTLPKLNSQELMAFLKSLDGKPNPLYCTSYPDDCNAPYTTFNFADTLPQTNPFNSYDVTEDTNAIYLEAEFSGSNWSGNLGVRVVQTKTTAKYAESVPVAVWTTNASSATPTYHVDYATSGPVSSSDKYTLVLPSLNVAYWLQPDKWQLRGAVSETMARPNLNQLAPNSTNDAINGDPSLFYSGKVGLQPIKSWNGDLSLEWYYAPHSAVTAAVFYKRVTDDIYSAAYHQVDLGTLIYDGKPGDPGTTSSPLLWEISAPANGAKSTYYGYELIWQHMWPNGFGFYGQYTHTTSKGYDETGASTGPVNSAPPETVSLSVIYDKGPFSADVTWDYTSSYTYACSQCTDIGGWPAISDSFDWMTASVHYRFGHGFEVYLEGKNLTDSIARTYLNNNPLLPWAPGQSIGASSSGVGAGYSAYGRSYVAGFAYRM